MRNNTKVSIVTVCFNSEKTIRDTIESVLHQTYPNMEYIMIDGKSSDRTLEIIKEYVPMFHGRLRYLSEKDKGIYDAVNKGIRLTKGSLIGIINSDDLYERDAVEKIVDHMTADKYQVVYGYCKLLYQGCTAGILCNRHHELDKKMIPHPACFVTRQTYRDFGLYLTSMKIVSDYELMLRFSMEKQIIFTQVPEMIACFREGGISTRPEMEERRILEKELVRYRYGKISAKEMALSFYRYLICR